MAVSIFRFTETCDLYGGKLPIYDVMEEMIQLAQPIWFKNRSLSFFSG